MSEAASLQKYAFFGGLSDEQIDIVRSLMKEEFYKKGETIILEGTTNDKLHFILEGKAVAIKGEVTLIEFKAGDTFGEMEILDIMPSAATIRALTDTQILSLSHRALHTISRLDLKIFSLIIMNLARDISRRLRRMDERALAPTLNPQQT
ncbi:MAG: cyclic nucleotide-binding domain-containing protein [Spirochaetaceae bacterium]|nr:cyclic nucleotide-binding domain-containing protein [Spirochaetaceae bacterium]